jgi:hypothetical protein
VTHLRKMMLEELQRRHYSEATTRWPTSFARAQTSSRGTVHGSAGPPLRSCWPSRAVATPQISACDAQNHQECGAGTAQQLHTEKP